jgi:hypothetical protein
MRRGDEEEKVRGKRGKREVRGKRKVKKSAG